MLKLLCIALSMFGCTTAEIWNNPEILIPTLNADNDICRQASEFYLRELRELKLWATEMFDATGKFPSGVLYGSPYDLGNFDQCLDVKVPYNSEHFSGKYCLGKFTIHSPSYVRKKVDLNFLEEYERFYNLSMWEKISAFYGDDSKASRNEIYFSFCLPSLCNHEDLANSLNKVITRLNITGFQLKAEINERNCQVSEEYHFNLRDFVFTFVIFLSVLIVSMCSICEYCFNREYFGTYKSSSKVYKIISCFSFPANVKKLCSDNGDKDNMNYIAGLKVISMFLIILGHRCMFIFGSPLKNPKFLEETYMKVEAMTILNGPIIVDTFFLISGYLASYFMLKTLKANSGILDILKIYLHRLIRILPSYAIIVAFYSTILASLGSGPFWKERVLLEQERCSKNWWTNLLFINNYVNVDNMCMLQSWYLTCDMHYFLLVPILVLILKKRPIVGVSVICTLIVASVLVVLGVVYGKYEKGILLLYPRLLKDPISNATFQTVYVPSHMRATPYLVGVLTGFWRYKGTPKLNKWFDGAMWCVGFVVALGTIHLAFIFYSPDVPKLSLFSAVYGAFHHFSFSLCISYVILSMSSGGGAWVEPILSWRPFVFLSRITYTAFLCHGAVQLYTAAILRAPSYSGVYVTFYQAAADIVMAYAFGFVLSMYFEAPILGIEKIILGRRRDNENNGEKDVQKHEV